MHVQLVLQELDTHLVVFSPYLMLGRVLESDAVLADLGQNAWAALNDAYRTDAPLLYAPHVLALGCVVLASIVCSRDVSTWLEGVDVDSDQARTRYGVVPHDTTAQDGSALQSQFVWLRSCTWHRRCCCCCCCCCLSYADLCRGAGFDQHVRALPCANQS
jgi:hypothetical protein